MTPILFLTSHRDDRNMELEEDTSSGKINKTFTSFQGEF